MVLLSVFRYTSMAILKLPKVSCWAFDLLCGWLGDSLDLGVNP